MPRTSPDHPLDRVNSIKLKLGLLVLASVVAAVVVNEIGRRAGVSGWISAPVTLVAALALTQWLSRGMISPLRDMTGAAARMSAGDYGQRVPETSSDEVGQLARAFNAMAGDLAAADQQRRQLVATVSHELRTPLTAQRALLENLVDGVVRPDDASLGAALTQAERLSDLVGDLLDLSRIDAGVAPLRLDEVRVADLLDRAVAEARVDARPVAHRVEVTPPDLVVSADPARLAQLVANLLDNAARHSPPNGEVRVTACASNDGDSWWLDVEDDGPGIPADRAERALGGFGSGADGGGGTGLGLAIAGWVCELHGGSIAVVPTPPGEVGARLRAVLPTSPNPRPLAEPKEQTMISPPPTPMPPPPASPLPVPANLPPNLYAVVPGSGTAGGSSLADSVFGGFWPERGIGPQLPLLLGSLGVGALAALILPDRNIGLALWLVTLAIAGVVLSRARNQRRPWTLACVALAVAIASMLTFRAAPWSVPLTLFIAGPVLAAGLTDAHRLLAFPASVAAWVFSGIRGLPLLGRTLTATSRMGLLWPVLRTVAISAVALVLFGGLFASADAIFGSWASALIPDLAWDSLTLRVFTFIAAAGITLAGSYLALNPPNVDRIAVPAGRPVGRRWEWLVPVSVLIALFLGFHAAQAAAMWGGHDYLRETTGLTYAEYVHQGFGQLTAVTFLTLLVVAMVTRKAPRETSGDRLLLRLVIGVLGVLALAVVASALYRMHLYQQAYGFTVLRVFVDGFELWLGLLIALVMVAGIRLSGRWLPRAALVSGAVLALGFGLMNPDAWVAQQNVARYAESGRVDLAYLAGLSADAVPAIRAGLPAEMASCAITQIQNSTRTPDDALSWNLGRSRAAGALDELPVVPEFTCQKYLAEDVGIR